MVDKRRFGLPRLRAGEDPADRALEALPDPERLAAGRGAEGGLPGRGARPHDGVPLPGAAGQLRDRDPAAAEGTHLLYGDPVVVRRHLQLEKPALEDQRADWERLHEALDRAKTTMPELTPRTAEAFAGILRDSDWGIDAFLEDSRLICIAAPADEPVYGFAIDLGTTTVDVSLHNMETGRRIGRKTVLNRQSAFGADVISRTQALGQDPEAVRNPALETIADSAEALLKENNVSRTRVVRSTVVGNSIMIHILHGLDPRQLTLAPYIPLVAGMVQRRPEEFGWDFQGCGHVETLPLISAFVGADTMGVILALDLEHEEEISLSIDIGTNGELVLGNREKLISSSCATGPAFEGAHIKHGMRAAPGAIEKIEIEPNTKEVRFKVIGKVDWNTDLEAVEAKGICGSGIIDAVAQMFRAGITLPHLIYHGQARVTNFLGFHKNTVTTLL